MRYIITEKHLKLIEGNFEPPVIKKKLTRKIVEFWYEKFKKFIDGRIGNLEEYHAKYYDKVYYDGMTPIFAYSGGQLFYNKEFFQILLTTMDEKLFNKVLSLWFEKKFGNKVEWAGWSESLQKKGEPD